MSSPYFQPPDRLVIQIERPAKADWIVWNWDHARWDELPSKVEGQCDPHPMLQMGEDLR